MNVLYVVVMAAADDDVMQTIKQEVLDSNDPFVKDAAKIGEGKPIGLGVEPIGPKPVPSPVNVQDEYQKQLAEQQKQQQLSSAIRTKSQESQTQMNRPGTGSKEVRFAPDTKDKKSKFCLLL